MPYDSAPDTREHIDAVNRSIREIIRCLLEQGDIHDSSKLWPPEKPIFDQYTLLLRQVEYGSDAYFAHLREMSVALTHHYETNPHHPEHYPVRESVQITILETDILSLEQDTHLQEEVRERLVMALRTYLAELRSQINGMDLIYLAEMFCDWHAASLRHPDGALQKSIPTNIRRFGLSAQIANIFENTRKRLDWR